jgi:hypothetical protein
MVTKAACVCSGPSGKNTCQASKPEWQVRPSKRQWTWLRSGRSVASLCPEGDPNLSGIFQRFCRMNAMALDLGFGDRRGANRDRPYSLGWKCLSVALWGATLPLGWGWLRARRRLAGNRELLRLSKRGNGYLRMLLIHGARTALPELTKTERLLSRWLKGPLARAHRDRGARISSRPELNCHGPIH